MTINWEQTNDKETLMSRLEEFKSTPLEELTPEDCNNASRDCVVLQDVARGVERIAAYARLNTPENNLIREAINHGNMWRNWYAQKQLLEHPDPYHAQQGFMKAMEQFVSAVEYLEGMERSPFDAAQRPVVSDQTLGDMSDNGLEKLRGDDTHATADACRRLEDFASWREALGKLNKKSAAVALETLDVLMGNCNAIIDACGSELEAVGGELARREEERQLEAQGVEVRRNIVKHINELQSQIDELKAQQEG